ncbi:unnamed protein product, partial [Prorocentrum cordatum]
RRDRDVFQAGKRRRACRGRGRHLGCSGWPLPRRRGECRDGRSLLNACRRAAAAARRRACSGASAPPRRACFSQEVSAGGRDGRGNVRGQERAALRSRRCDFFGRQAFHRPVPGAWSLRGRFVFQPRASVLA